MLLGPAMAALYEIDDPVQRALECPYTFFLPSADLIDAVREGDCVKVVVRAVPPSEKYDAERMWICVTAIGADWFEGTLDSVPQDMPLLKLGMPMKVPKTAVIEVDLADPGRAPPKREGHREYWERCLVDDDVIQGKLKVDYLYREEPDMGQEGDKFPDSGWRIRGDLRNCSDDDIETRKMSYVAIGLVLNADDTWLHLIDEPVGSKYIKDFDRDEFVKSK